MRIVLGLGNPGERYRSTRHNVGFRVVDLLAGRMGCAFRRDSLWRSRAWVARGDTVGGPVILAKPRTFMNRSGQAALALRRRHAADVGDFLVVYDDADLPLGRIRLRRGGGGAGGHNGVGSLIDSLEHRGFQRIRLGVGGAGRADTSLARYVLAPFEPAEEPLAQALVELGAEALETVFEHGFEIAMNRYNGRAATA